MKYIRRLVIGSLVLISFLYACASSKKTNIEEVIKQPQVVEVDSIKTESSIDNKVNNQTAQVDSTKTVKEKKITKYNINAGGMYNDVSNSASFSSELTLVKKIEIEISYDHIKANENIKKVLKKPKEKRLLIANCEYNLGKNSKIGISYDSDKVIGLYSTLFKGGLKKTFSSGLANGLNIDVFTGLKVGKINFSKEKENVIGTSIKYKMPSKYTDLFNFSLKGDFNLPRKYIQGNMFDGPWVGQAIASLDFPITKKVSLGLTYDIRRDYIPGPNLSLIREGINLKLNITSDEKKSKK